jgi:hypothetical protein
MKYFLGCMLCLSSVFAGDGYLYTRYLQAQVIDQVVSQQENMCEGLSASKSSQVAEAFSQWRQHQLGRLKSDLENELGENARTQFSDFARNLSEAQQQEDNQMLQNISEELNFDPVPQRFTDLQSVVLNQRKDSLLPEAANFLGEVETWTALPDSAPPLSAWLSRNQNPAPPPKPQPTVNPLRAAEAAGNTWVPPEEESVNPMDAFTQSRNEKREQALEDAHAGMRQVASERESYERDQASKELAKSREDAEAMRAQAQRLAATEEEALAQRENSWGNRLKRIVGGTISAATGAFTGGIGAEAGQRAANAVFN